MVLSHKTRRTWAKGADTCEPKGEVSRAITSKGWRDFFSSLYSSGKDFYVRSGYGSLFSLRYRVEKVRQMIERIHPMGRILDVGCGIGNFVEIFQHVKYFGLDFSREALEEHRSRYGKPVVLGDAHLLPFRSASFSFALAVEVMQYMDDHEMFIREISRVLENGGVAVLISPNPDSVFWIIRQKLRGRSPLHFVSIDRVLRISEDLHMEGMDGIFPIPFPFLRRFFDRFVNLFPDSLRMLLVKFLSKSFILVLRKAT